VNELASSAGRRGFVRRAAATAAAVVGGASLSAIRPGLAQAREPAGPESVPGTANWIGEIVLVPYNFAPRGFAFCEGQELPISQNQSLYALIGNNYGGDGRTTFKLPDTRPLEEASKKVARAAPPPFRHAIALTGNFPSRA
jgi:hypothetical protein